MDEALFRAMAAAERARLTGLEPGWDGQGAAPPTGATFDAALEAAAAEIGGFFSDRYGGEAFFYPGFDGEVEIDLLRGRDRLIVIASPVRPLYKPRKTYSDDLLTALSQFRAEAGGKALGYADDEERHGTLPPTAASVDAAAAFAAALSAASPDVVRRLGAIPMFSDDTEGGTDLRWIVRHVFDMLVNFGARGVALSLFSHGWNFCAWFPAGIGPGAVEWLAHVINCEPGWSTPPYPAPPGADADFHQEPSRQSW